jgi:ABC-type glycerol-3-phosphate transport system substrate-binding protein
MTLQWHPAQSGRAGTLVRQTRRHLLAVMAGAATACRLGTRPVAEPQPAQQRTTRELELTYMPWDQARPDLLPTLEQVLQRFTAKYPNLKVTPMPAGGTYIEKLKTLVAAGTPPDVADTHHSQVRDLGATGIVQDLAPFLKRDPYPKEHTGWEPYQWQGKQYGIPWGLQSSCIFYNKALFNQAGLPYPPDDWTWEQFLEVARRLTKPAPNEAEAQWGGGGLRRPELPVHACAARYLRRRHSERAVHGSDRFFSGIAPGAGVPRRLGDHPAGDATCRRPGQS